MSKLCANPSEQQPLISNKTGIVFALWKSTAAFSRAPTDQHVPQAALRRCASAVVGVLAAVKANGVGVKPRVPVRKILLESSLSAHPASQRPPIQLVLLVANSNPSHLFRHGYRPRIFRERAC